jgi:hypothetical protein
MAGVPTKLRTALIVQLGVGGLLADLHCDSLELLLLKVMLRGNVNKKILLEAGIMQFLVD